MALDGGVRGTEIRIQFSTREGTYKQMPNSEYCRPNRVPYTAQGPPSTFTPVKASFADIKDEDEIFTRIIFTIGRDLYYFNYEGVKQPVDLTKPLDKRTYKGVAPTCHDINRYTATVASVRVAVGFAAGQVQIIDVGTKQSLQILNEERMVEKVSTTCVLWVPDSDSLLISSHANGHMYTYDAAEENMNVVPQYHERPWKTSEGISIYTLKNKTYTAANGQPLGTLKNLLYKWVVTEENAAIHEFRFSPDGQCIAIVSQDGYLRVMEYSTFEVKGSMKSYFGGLLCCCWSPDGRYIVTGGEDDLVTVWSFLGGFVIARGHGHRSWVSNVAFDVHCCIIPDEEDVINWYGRDSPALPHHDIKHNYVKRQGMEVENQSPKHQGGKNSSDSNSREHIRPSKKNLLRSPVIDLQDSERRQRTYSNVSRLSRLSLTGSADASPCISYRFGSVGQDAQLCLWELTDDILFPRRRTGAVLLGSYGSAHSRGKGEAYCSHFFKPSCDHVPSTVNGCHSKGSREEAHVDIPEIINDLYDNEGKGKHFTPNSINSSTSKENIGSSRGLHFFSSKDSSKADHGAQTISGKFATLGAGRDGNRRKENTKDHKRNLSLPYFGSRNSSHSQNASNGLGKHHIGKKHQEVKTLGTFLCPRLDETAMLEPLVCKRITQGRLTCISFQKDSIVTACQDGFIQTWARPQQYQLQISASNISSSSPTKASSPSSPPSGTIV